MNTDQATTAAALSVFRTFLSAIGGIAVTLGYISQGTSQQIVGAVLDITGAAMVLFPLIWGVINKFRAEHKIQVRTTDAVNVGIMAANTGLVGNSVSHAVAQDLIATVITPTVKGQNQ